MSILQVSSKHYQARRYLTLIRNITHWHQASSVADCTLPEGSVLEIGPGTGHTSWLIKLWGFNVTTIDIDEDLHPDIVSSVTNIDIADDSFDCVIAAEVLEHLPYEDFEKALKEIRRVTKKNAVISLPAPLVGISFLINIPKLNQVELSLGLPYMVAHKFDGEHYWELGKRGYSKTRIKQSIENSGFTIVKNFRPAPSLFSYFFILKKC